MDTVDILNNYRATIASDKGAVQILSALYRFGPQSEEELADQVKDDLREVRIKVSELFRAHLIRLTVGRRWMVTALADEVLARLGIAEVAVRSLLEEQEIDDTDKSFLEACTMTRASRDASWPKYQVIFLLCLDDLKKDALQGLSRSPRALSDLLYGSIVGLDSDAQQVGGATYVHYVLDWHSANHSELWTRWRDDWFEKKALYENMCDEAVAFVRFSNEDLANPARERTGQKDSARTLTLLRALSAILSGVSDPGMSALVRADRGIWSNIWDALRRAFPEMEKRIDKLLHALGLAETKEEDLYHKLVQATLQREEVGISSRPAPGGAFSRMEDWLEGTLRKVKVQIEAGAETSLSSKMRETLLKALDEALEEFHEHASEGSLEGRDGATSSNQGSGLRSIRLTLRSRR